MTEIRLKPGSCLSGLEAELKKQAAAAENTRNTFVGRHPKDYLDAYLSWVNEAARMLGSHLQCAQLESLLHTRHFWALRQMDGTEAWLTGQVKEELTSRQQACTELATEAGRLARHWDIAGMIVLPDTNMLVHTTEFFDEFDWSTALDIDTDVHLVIPLVVIDQLDRLKRATQPVRSRARQVGNRIENWLGGNRARAPAT